MIKEWIRKKLFPEYEEVRKFMTDIEDAKTKSIELCNESNIKFEKPVIFIGSLVGCKVSVEPKLKPEIILSRLDLSAILHLSGRQHTVTNSFFTGKSHKPVDGISIDTEE